VPLALLVLLAHRVPQALQEPMAQQVLLDLLVPQVVQVPLALLVPLAHLLPLHKQQCQHLRQMAQCG